MSTGPVDFGAPEEKHNHKFTHDVIIIGGGSGGLACSKRCKEWGMDVAVCDFVTPSPTLGTKWGLGGTCVNVGCIPKKLMHTSALLGEGLRHSLPSYGWRQSPEATAAAASADWTTLRQNVTMHVRSLNFGYNVELREEGVKYYNALASFDPTDPTGHTLLLTNKDNVVTPVTARRVVLAMGGRPTIPTDAECPGARQYGITSDDVFRLEKDPGKTCVVGASYVALECAGMLRGIGREVTVLIRSIPLRGYDQDMAGRAVKFMEEVQGVRFLKRTIPTKVEPSSSEPGRFNVYWKSEEGETGVDVFDTILFAVGRTPETRGFPVTLGKSNKVVVDQWDRTSIPHVYAIGDLCEGGLELTPVAIRQGRLLADRLYAGGTQTISYVDVATTVFTPLEYGCVGLSEEAAITKFGDANINVYHSEFTPLEWTVPHLPANMCYMKLITLGEDEVVVGFHVLCPNAGEITQGVAIAIRAKATKAVFDETIGIHPTIAEEMTILRITKRSGESASKKGC